MFNPAKNDFLNPATNDFLAANSLGDTLKVYVGWVADDHSSVINDLL